jgi:hypothetical protein
MLNPIRVRRQILIRAAPEDVWRLMENPGAARGLLPNGTSIELLTDRFDQVGSRWRVVTRHGEHRVAMLNEVVAIERPVSQVLRSTSDRMAGSSRTTLTPINGGTLMVLEGTAEFPPGLRSLPDRLLTAVLGPISTQRALKRMKRYVEDTAT